MGFEVRYTWVQIQAAPLAERIRLSYSPPRTSVSSVRWEQPSPTQKTTEQSKVTASQGPPAAQHTGAGAVSAFPSCLLFLGWHREPDLPESVCPSGAPGGVPQPLGAVPYSAPGGRAVFPGPANVLFCPRVFVPLPVGLCLSAGLSAGFSKVGLGVREAVEARKNWWHGGWGWEGEKGQGQTSLPWHGLC